ncbi:MAG: hypothetical protein ACP5GJ_04045 [Nanopusillaceae archaeon]
MDEALIRSWNIHFHNLFRLYDNRYVGFIDIETYPKFDENLSFDNVHIISVAMLLPVNHVVNSGNIVTDEYELEPFTVYGGIDDEKRILEHLGKILYNKLIGQIVGYGIMYLDIPLLIYKARKYNIKPLTRFFSIVSILDLVVPTAIYMYAKKGDFKFYSLKDIVQELNLDEKYEFTEDLYSDINKLVEYNLRDVNNIRKLYDFLKKLYMNRNYVNFLKI